MNQEYKNSLGYQYAEQCVSCPHKPLCFQYLEYAGDVTRPGRPIFGGCAEIRANPEKMQAKLDELWAEWHKRMERNSVTTYAEGY